MALDTVKVRIGLPFGSSFIEGNWSPDETERQAAWEMLVELSTRVTVVGLGPTEGLLRETLTSYHSLFETTRTILKTAGPAVAGSNERVSFAHLAVAILNRALRPLLATWHALLEDHETRRPADQSPLEWERTWEHHDELRQAINDVGRTLADYAKLLGTVCDARPLVNLALPPNEPEPSH